MPPEVEFVLLEQLASCLAVPMFIASAEGDLLDLAIEDEFVEILAGELGLGINAGHDLDLHNLPRFAGLPGLLEVSIGHALTVDAIRIGFANAINAYQKALGK